MSEQRTCPAPDCRVTIARNQFACRRHWFRLSADVRAAINAAWKAKDWTALRESQAAALAYFDRFVKKPPPQRRRP